MLHDGSATSLFVDSASSMTVLQGKDSEKISTCVKHINRRILGVRQQFSAGIYEIDCPSGFLARATRPTSVRPTSSRSSSSTSAR
jgi:hypothetical protein